VGQRVAKMVNGQITEKYQWLNLTTLLAIYDANGNLIQRYGYSGERTPTVLQQNNQYYYIVNDYQGTPKLVTDASGNIIKSLSYDSFGNLIQDSNSSFRLPFGYAGGLYDPDTGLILFGFRDYIPDVGRWTAKDPIGFAGGDTNLYGYVWQNPINWIDPEGLIALPALPAIAEAVAGALAWAGEAIAGTGIGVAICAYTGWCSLNESSDDSSGSTGEPNPKDLTDNIGKIADKTGLSEKDVLDAIHRAKDRIPKGTKKRNPDCSVDTKTGEIYPQTPDGGIGDSIGNIFD
jgi:RHS repeat-associated protein